MRDHDHDDCRHEHETPHRLSRRRMLQLAPAAAAAAAPAGLLAFVDQALAQVGDQADWRFCNKCHAMFWNGVPHKGNCPAGGAHNAQGFLFFIHYDSSKQGTHQLQYDWRFCQKCMSLFWDGYANKGRCPAGGGHVAQGLMFGLDHRPPAPQHKYQTDWRFCNKCNVLFWDGSPNKGRCPAGGGHFAQGFNFHMIFKPLSADPVRFVVEGAQGAFNSTSHLLAQFISAQLATPNLVCGGCTLSNNLRFGTASFSYGNQTLEIRIPGNYLYLRLRNDTILGSWADPAVEVHFDLAARGSVVMAGGKPSFQAVSTWVPRVTVKPRTGTGAILTTLVRFAQLTGPGGRAIQQAHDRYLRQDFTKFLNGHLQQWV